MPAVLKETLRPASGIDFTLTEILPVCEAVQGTVANLKDGDDATGSTLTAINEGDPNANGTYREEWSLDAAAVSGSISFVRVIARIKRTDSVGGGSFTATYRPSINGTPRGVEHAAGAVANDEQDFPTDPSDGLAWTLAKINGQKFGWFLVAGMVIPPLGQDDVVTCSVVDFRVEIWGEGGAHTVVEMAGAVTPIQAEGAVGPIAIAGALGESASGTLSAPVLTGGAIGQKAEGRLRTS